MRPKRSQPQPQNSTPALTFQSLQAVYPHKGTAVKQNTEGPSTTTPASNNVTPSNNNNNSVTNGSPAGCNSNNNNNAKGATPLGSSINVNNNNTVAGSSSGPPPTPTGAARRKASTSTPTNASINNTQDAIAAALSQGAYQNVFPHHSPASLNTEGFTTDSAVANTGPGQTNKTVVLYPSDMGPLKPGKRAQQGLPSGTHIRRRPPSVPRRGGVYGSPSGTSLTVGGPDFSSPPTVPLGDTPPGDRPGDSTSAGPAAAEQGGHVSRDAKPLKYERRADPSPAPSRQPRANRRKHISLNVSPATKALSTTTGSSMVAASTPQHPRQVYDKPDSPYDMRRPPSGRPLCAIERGSSSNKANRADVIRTYTTLCQELGETANEEWLEVLSAQPGGPSTAEEGGAAEASTSQLSASEGAETSNNKNASDRKPRLPAKSSNETTAQRTKSPGGAARAWTGGSSHSRMPRSSSVGRMGGAGGVSRPTLFSAGASTSVSPSTAASLSLKPPMNSSSVQRSAAETCLDNVVAYCEQHLLPFRRKMDLLRQRRETVKRNLEAFLQACAQSDTTGPCTLLDASHNVFKSSTNSQRRSSTGEQSTAASSLQGSPRVGTTKLPTVMIGLQQRASCMSERLSEVQSSVAQLLLRLEECAKEVRKPLGSVVATISSSSNNHNTSSNTTPVVGGPLSPLGLEGLTPLSDTIAASSSSPGASLGPGRHATPRGFINFVVQQEKEVAVELLELRDSIREALCNDPLVRVGDRDILRTPLFIPSGVATVSGSEDPLSQETETLKSVRGGADTRSPRTGQITTGGKSRQATATGAGRITPRSTALTPRQGVARTPRSTATTTITPRAAAVDAAAATPRSRTTAKPKKMSTASMSISSRPQFVVAFPGSDAGITSHRSDSSGSLTAASPMLVLGACAPANASPRSLESSVPSVTSPQQQKRGRVTNRKSPNVGTKPRSRSASVGAGKKATKRSNSVSLRSGAGAGGSYYSTIPEKTDIITATQLERAKNVWDAMTAFLLADEESHSQQMSVPSQAHLSPVQIHKLSPPNSLLETVAGIGLPHVWDTAARGTSPAAEAKPASSGCVSPTTTLASNTLAPPSEITTTIAPITEDDSSTAPPTTTTERIIKYRPGTSPTSSEHTIATKLDLATAASTADEASGSASRQTVAPAPLDFTEKQRDAARSIFTWWRHHRGEKAKVPAADASGDDAQTLQADRFKRMVRENCVKRFLKQLVRRQRLQRALSLTRALDLGTAERRDIVLGVLETGVCPNLQGYAMLELNLNTVQPAASSMRSGTSSNTAKGPALTTRERFQRAREQRKSMTESARSPPRTKLSVDTKTSTESAAVSSVPPLPLQASGISTKSIANYNTDADGFELSVLHRLLRAPQPLLYAVRMAVDRYPSQPPMGYARMKDANSNQHEVSPSVDRAEASPSPDRFANHNDKDVARSLSKSLESSGVFHVPFRVVKQYLPYVVCVPAAASESDSHRTAVVNASGRGESNPRRSQTRPHVALDEQFIPRSVRFESIVEANELRHEEPVVKPFVRPFERWGMAYGFARRVFAAAAIYAWKLIFSHTPHDDLKQKMLRHADEQQARLDRVHHRNRMILACYCVRTEREWLREASKDLSFVGQIWNPKKSMDPNDPDLDQHCRETYAFVEDFLYQCFPTANSLEEVPPFLVGAGIFFTLKEALHYHEVFPTQGTSSRSASTMMQADVFAQRHPELVASGPLVRPQIDASVFEQQPDGSEDGKLSSAKGRAGFSAYDLAALQKYEQIVLLDKVSVWWQRSHPYHMGQPSEAARNHKGKRGKSAFLQPVASTSSFSPTRGPSEGWAALAAVTRSGASLTTPTAPPSLSCELQIHSPLAAQNDCKREGDLLFDDNEDADADEEKATDNNNIHSNGRKPNSQAQDHSAATVEVVRVPSAAIQSFAPRYKDSGFLREREEAVMNALAHWSRVEDKHYGHNTELLVLYQKGFLARLSERLAYELLGLKLNLEVCEDLDCID